jgi:hypothetical protein
VGRLAPARDALDARARLPGGLALGGRKRRRSRQQKGDFGGGDEPELIPLRVPEVRRLILAMARAEEEREFRLGWSLWRRAHQAVARRCHSARRAFRHETPLPPGPLRSPTDAATEAVAAPTNVRLTDEGWELLKPLLPAQKPLRGRPRRDHRTVIAGMLWVLGSGASWRDLPEKEFGPWQTVYGRYRKWCREGLWQRIVEALGS